MSEIMICTADASNHSRCSSGCSTCNYLMADRRGQQIKTIRWSHSEDRRIMSNWFPSNYELAGAGFSATRQRPFFRDVTLAGSFPLLLALMLVSFNLFDSLLTARALSMGFTEANPVMAGLFSMSLPMGMFFKSVIVVTGALVLWKFRHLPVAMRGMTAVTGCYGAVILYHLYFQMLVI